MSETYHLVCEDCKEHLWVGQGWGEVHIYKAAHHMAALEAFLDKHTGRYLGNGHTLRLLPMGQLCYALDNVWTQMDENDYREEHDVSA